MKIRSEEPEDVQNNMTAMIDIVFQLLIFFILTFKVAAREGDFNIQMPLSGPTSSSISEDEPELILVSLKSGDQGVISTIEVSDNEADLTFGPGETMFEELTQYIEAKLAAKDDPELAAKTEVEFDIEYDLKYAYTVRAIDAVSGIPSSNGDPPKKLIKTIKFKNNLSGG